MTDFDINSDPKTWRTRDGRKLVIYCTDAPGDYPIHGRIEGSQLAKSWRMDGCYSLCVGPSDLISPRKTVKVDFWVNVYEDGCNTFYRHKENADTEALEPRIACKHIVMEVTEGEFDQ